jgi:hypothetical protein
MKIGVLVATVTALSAVTVGICPLLESPRLIQKANQSWLPLGVGKRNGQLIDGSAGGLETHGDFELDRRFLYLVTIQPSDEHSWCFQRILH